jgi:N-acetylglucosaminyl-diphospho-decaprenol L-rhamnosyltransferase
VTRLTIVIVAFNARDELAGTLASLTTLPPSTAHEIVVVDNASTDGVPELVRSRFSTVRLVEAGANLGFARANNLAIRQSTSELVLLLNPDTIVPAGAIDQLVARLDSQPDVAVVGPRIVDANGRAELSWGHRVTPWSERSRKALVQRDQGGESGASAVIDRETRTARDVAWLTGACLLARRLDAEAVGLLDERYFLYMEDVDFCDAVRARGRRIRFEPSVEVVHLRGRSGLASGGAAERAWHASHLAYYRKHLPLWAPLLWAYQRLRE